MLERLNLRHQLIFWEGRYFLASIWLDEEERSASFFTLVIMGSAFRFATRIGRPLRLCFAGAGRPPRCGVCGTHLPVSMASCKKRCFARENFRHNHN